MAKTAAKTAQESATEKKLLKELETLKSKNEQLKSQVLEQNQDLKDLANEKPGKKTKGKVMLEHFNEKGNGTGNYIHRAANFKSIGCPEFSVMKGSNKAHEFTIDEANEFLDQPGANQYLMIEA
jgi:hypothetical protein